VYDKLYKVAKLHDLNSYGFEIVIPPCKHHRIMCYWYNGGAGLYEVIEEAIKRFIDDKED